MNWPLLQNSLLVSAATTLLTMALGFMAALWLAGAESRWRSIGLVFAIAALAMPPFLVTNCWLDLLGANGVLRGWLPLNIFSLPGAAWILALLLWPITALAVWSRWERLEPELLEVEPELRGGAIIRHMLLPVARTPLLLAGALTFVLALNNFAVPAILQVKVFPAEMWVGFSSNFDSLAALKLSLPLIIAPLVVLAVFARSDISWPALRGNLPARIFRRQLGQGWFVSAALLTLVICGLSVGVPVLQLASTARTWSELPGAVEAGQGALWNSVWLAAATASVCVGVALGSARLINTPLQRGAGMWAIIRNRFNGFGVARETVETVASSSRGQATPLKRGVNEMSSILHSSFVISSWLPFLTPGVLIGIAFIWIFNRPATGWFYSSFGVVVLAFVVRYFALGQSITRHALQTTDSDLNDAARLEGASRWQTFRFVQWPQIAPQVGAAWYVIYLLCLWDVESLVLIVPPGGETLALRIFNLLHYGHNAQVNALCLTLLGTAIAPLAIWKAVTWATRSSSKHQHPSSREEPNSKLQTSRGGRFSVQKAALKTHALQTLSRPPMTSALREAFGVRWLQHRFGVWRLKFLWMLVLGAWCFISGCSPPSSSKSASLQSKFFERAEVIATRGVGVGEVNKPRSVAVDHDDNLYVVDMTGRVQKFATDGKFLLSWQMPQTTLGKPKGMGCDNDGNIIVVEPHYKRVNHFTPDGKLVAQWGLRGTNVGWLDMPRSVAMNSKREIFLSEYGLVERVQKFSLGVVLTNAPTLNWNSKLSDAEALAETRPTPAKFLACFGAPGGAPGEFNRAEGICVDAQDRLYVADSCNHRVQVFTSEGKFIREFGRPGTGPGELSYPYDIKVDAAGNILVCEFGNSRIQVFDDTGRSVEIIGGAGGHPGQFNNPWAIALDSHGNLYVADALNHRVQKLVRKAETAKGFEFIERGGQFSLSQRERAGVREGVTKEQCASKLTNPLEILDASPSPFIPLPLGEGDSKLRNKLFDQQLVKVSSRCLTSAGEKLETPHVVSYQSEFRAPL